MKHLFYLSIAALGLMWLGVNGDAQSFGDMGFGEHNSRMVLRINPDGTCVLTNWTTQSRRSLEMQVVSWERMSKMSEDADDEDSIRAMAQLAKKDQKPLTDQDLVSKTRQMYEGREDSEDEEGTKLDSVEVTSNSVRLVTTRAYASPKELLSQNAYAWGPNVLMPENVRAEIDTNHNFRITFIPGRDSARYTRVMSRQWKSAKTDLQWKLILPGKILSSGFPNTEATSTWLDLASDRPETIDAALKIIGTPVVVTAEPAGLKLEEPLESKKLVQTAWKARRTDPDLPITEAGPGFTAEPISIAVSTVHRFPEGEKYFKDRPASYMFGIQSTGAVVSAKLFPPKGRELKNVTAVLVKAAKDDQGRPISLASENADEPQNYRDSVTFDGDAFNGGDSQKSAAARIELRLGLPAPDAKSIDELQAEAVALTIGGWKEMMITNAQADPQKEIDLGEVMPGAKLTIKKIAGKKSQKTVQVTLEGPKEISQLDVKIKLSSRRGGQSMMNERRSKTTGDKTTRNLTVQAYEFEMGGEAEGGPLTLLVRYPQDVKRERVQFKLNALDLL